MLTKFAIDPATVGIASGEIVCATITAVENGTPIIDLGAPIGKLEAISIVTIGKSDIGRLVAVAFSAGVGGAPIVLGRMAQPSVTVDDTSTPLKITGEREITLRCGKASITLTKAGKIILRGTYISSRSSGMNRIKGGSVQLN